MLKPITVRNFCQTVSSFLATANCFLVTSNCFLATVSSFLPTASCFLGTVSCFLATDFFQFQQFSSFLQTAMNLCQTVSCFLATACSFLGTASSFLATVSCFLATVLNLGWCIGSTFRPGCTILGVPTCVYSSPHFASTFGRSSSKAVINSLRQISLQNGSRSSLDVIRTGGFSNRFPYRAIKN